MRYLILSLLLLFSVFGFSQVDFTANDSVGQYNYPFAYGTNMGYYPGWKDKNLADIAAGNPELEVKGAGVNGMRPALFEHFLEYYGYDVRIEEFEHYQSLGINYNTVFVGYPSDEHRDPTPYCASNPSEVFANLYTPIWDNGENGTPVNDENYYALYLYKMVDRYKDFVKVWEIWNEPDFDFSSNAWKPKSFPESWWNEDPDPCDYALYAPPSHYIRMLRISWEVIKTYAPESYVAVGGLGYPSFLNIILKNTDNPEDGTANADFPHYGGAYFDMLSYHSYPHIDGSLRDWNNDIGDFDYFRHSDAAIAGLLLQKAEFEEVLTDYGYTGTNLPEKQWIITECNIPRKQVDNFIGSEQAQINFLMKALTISQREAIHQFHIFNLGEKKTFDEAESEYHMMGLYQKLEGTAPYQQKINKAGITYKTMSDLLGEYTFDLDRTATLRLTSKMDGAAFKSADGKYRYVLWAKTRKDRSEEALENFEFPSDWEIKGINIYDWEYSETEESQFKIGSNILLTGEPVIIETLRDLGDRGSQLYFEVYPNPFQEDFFVNLYVPDDQRVRLYVADQKGSMINRFFDGEEIKSGLYQFEIQGATSPGMYYCFLESKSLIETKKIVKLASQ